MKNKEFYELIEGDIFVRDSSVRNVEFEKYSKKWFRHIKRNSISMYFNRNEKIFRLTYWYRVKQNYSSRNSFIGMMGRFMYRKYNRKYQTIIGTANIGMGLHIVHDSNAFINANMIGKYCTIFQNVTIGVDGKGGKPTIGNHVRIYSNAVICGNIRVGDRCIIGANAFVNRDLPDDSVVINNCTIVKRRTISNKNE